MSFWTLRDRPDVELVACPSPCGLMAVVWRGLDPQVESVFLGARLAFCDFTLAISNRCIVSNTLLSRARLVRRLQEGIRRRGSLSACMCSNSTLWGHLR